MRWYRAVALDLDGTLTTGGWPRPGVLDAIAALRGDGVSMLLVTGRILAELDVEFAGLADRFDVVVAENGCVLRTADWTRTLADPVDAALLDRLHEAGFVVRRGQVLLATDAAADHVALDAVEALGLDVHLVRNRAALMLMPAGITKGTGLREALAELGVSRHNTLAVGDAENDHALLAAAGLGVAVANAVDSLRRHADLVLDGRNGSGVADLLAGPVLDGRERVHPPRWRIVLGTDAAGQPAALPAAQTNLLITGASESGKSYLTGLIIEQLVALGYVLLVVDPEGDHVSLGALRGVTVLAGAGLPDPTGPVVANLHEFIEVLPTVPAAVIAHHARHGDFSRWLGAVYRDHVAAALVATTEHDLLAHGDAERTRRLLGELIAFRYLPPDQPPALTAGEAT